MRSFGSRVDTRVVDEPLYGHYLATTSASHPGREELVDQLETDARRAIAEVILGPSDRPILFCKQMAHHLTPDVDLAFLDRCDNVLLIRHPAEVITSLSKNVPEPTARDIGLDRQVELLEELRKIGQEPVVLDATELLLDPESVLKELCRRLEITWDAAMLSWEPDPRPEDGPWAPYWYDSVIRSTGFEPYRPKRRPVAARHNELLENSLPAYEKLFQLAIRAAAAPA
ncbi:MAG: sulfotransferase family protein [Actinomycetota bacterium]|nr:sulfotransferase family protein [Actinomycetota bacterium]